MSKQKQCVTCSKSGGILTCDGCQQTFCGIHVIKHRQDLANQLDSIMQEHDLLQQELTRSSDEHVLLKQINEWEKESITKIQVAAEAARADLGEMIENSKKQLSRSCHDIAVNVRSSREADDFSENDLNQWTQQLKELKLEITSSSSVQLIEDERSIIRLIAIRDRGFEKKVLINSKNDSSPKYTATPITQERFSKVIVGDGRINEEGLLATCTSSAGIYPLFLGQQRYSEGRHTMRFKIELSTFQYNIFFGCISSHLNDSEIHFNSSFAVGWFGLDKVYQHNVVNRNARDHGYKSDEIKTNDVLQLTFDCEKKQIELFQERTNRRHRLAVNIDKTPFPWQLLLVLTRNNDSVRILH